MTSVGPIYGSSCSNDAAVGNTAWDSPTNFEGDTTGFYANINGALSANDSNYLKSFYVHGLSSGDVITNISWDFERACDATDAAASDNYVQLIVDGVIQATNKKGGNWPTTKAFSSAYSGAPTAYWGYSGTLTGASTIGIAMAANTGGKHSTAYAYRSRMTITYTPAGSSAVKVITRYIG